jgi:hypothetical protein
VKLFHYTCACDDHLGSILADGVIRTTTAIPGPRQLQWEISPWATTIERNVVWLTSDEDITSWDHDGGDHDKATARIVVEEQFAHRWVDWCVDLGVDARSMANMFAAQPYLAKWYIVDGPILRGEWVRFESRLPVGPSAFGRAFDDMALPFART